MIPVRAADSTSAQPEPRHRIRNSSTVYVPKDNREPTAKRLATLLLNFLPGKRLKVTIEEEKAKRSDLQNRALWGVAYRELEEQSGNEPEDLHAYFCGEFFGWEKYEVFGDWKKRPVRTTTTNAHGERDVINKTSFAEFYSFIQRRSAEVGFFVSDPDPLWFEKPQAQRKAA